MIRCSFRRYVTKMVEQHHSRQATEMERPNLFWPWVLCLPQLSCSKSVQHRNHVSRPTSSLLWLHAPLWREETCFASFPALRSGNVEISQWELCSYVAGENPVSKNKFHIQLTAVIDETPLANIYDAMRHLPDVVAAPSTEQLLTSKGHMVLVAMCKSRANRLQ